MTEVESESVDIKVLQSMLKRPCSEKHKQLLNHMLKKAQDAQRETEQFAMLQKKYGAGSELPDSPLPTVLGSKRKRSRKNKSDDDSENTPKPNRSTLKRKSEDDSENTPKPKKRPGRTADLIDVETLTTPGSLSVGSDSPPPPPPSDSSSSEDEDASPTKKGKPKRRRRAQTPGGRKNLGWCTSEDEAGADKLKTKKPKWTEEEIAVLYTIGSDWKDVVKRSWASGSNNADRNAKKKVAYLAIKNAVNVVGGKKRSRQECYYKMIDYKSVLRAKVKKLNRIQKQSGGAGIKDTDMLSKLEVMVLAFYGPECCGVVPGAWRRPVETDTSISGISSACRLFGRMKIAQMEEKKAATDFKNDSLRQKKVQKAEYGVSHATYGIPKEEAEKIKKEVKEANQADESQIPTGDDTPNNLRRSPRKRKCVPDTAAVEPEQDNIDDEAGASLTALKSKPRRSPRLKKAPDGTEADTESDQEDEPQPQSKKTKGKLSLNKKRKADPPTIVVGSSPEESTPYPGKKSSMAASISESLSEIFPANAHRALDFNDDDDGDLPDPSEPLPLADDTKDKTNYRFQFVPKTEPKTDLPCTATSVSGMKAEVSKLANEVHVMIDDVKSMKINARALADITTATDGLVNEVKQTAVVVGRMHSDSDMLTVNAECTRKDVKAIKTEVGSMYEEVKTTKSDTHVMKGQLGSISIDMQDFKADMSKGTADISVLRHDVELIKNDIQDLDADMKSVRKDVRQIKHDVAQSVTSLLSIGTFLSQFSSEIKSEIGSLSDNMSRNVMVFKTDDDRQITAKSVPLELVPTTPKPQEPATAEPQELAPATAESQELAPATAESQELAPATAEPQELAPATAEPQELAPATAEPQELAPATAEPGDLPVIGVEEAAEILVQHVQVGVGNDDATDDGESEVEFRFQDSQDSQSQSLLPQAYETVEQETAWPTAEALEVKCVNKNGKQGQMRFIPDSFMDALHMMKDSDVDENDEGEARRSSRRVCKPRKYQE